MKDEEYYQYSNSCYIKTPGKSSTASSLKLREERLIRREKALKTLQNILKEKERQLNIKEKELALREQSLNKKIEY